MEKLHHLPIAQLFFAIVLAATFNQAALAQPCKAIDGNCAIQLPKPDINWSSLNLPPIQSIAGDLALGPDQPGMLGAITFRGNGSVCMGLLRRGGCN